MSKRNRSSYIDSDSDEKSNNDLEEGLKKLSKKANYSKNYSESSSDSENEEWNTKKKTSKSKKKTTKNTDAEVEDGEVTDSSDGEMFNDGFGNDMIGDQVDRDYLDNMNEVQRETVLYNRVQRREVMQTRFEIEKKLRAKRKDELEREKRDIGSSHDADSRQRKHSQSSKRSSKERRRRGSPSPSASSGSSRAGSRSGSASSSSSHSSSRGSSSYSGSPSPRRRSTTSSSASKKDRARIHDSDSEGDASRRSSSPRGQSHQRSDRRKTMERGRKESKHTSALENLKLKREEKKKNSELLEQKAKLLACDVYSDDDDDDNNGSSDSVSSSDSRSSYSGSESESESDTETQKIRQLQNTSVSDMKEINVIRLSRNKMEKWCHMPFFADTVKGCYVRIGIGSEKGMSVYRLCEIMDVLPTAKVYNLGSTRTNKGVKLRFGTAERVYRLEFVSNTNCTEKEFNFWKDTLIKANKKLPTLYDIEQKRKQIGTAMSYTFNENDIVKIIESKKKFKKNPTNYAIQKTILMKSRDMAEVEGNSEKKDDYQQQLDSLEERASELDRIRSKHISSVSYINQRNRQRNHVEAEQAAKQDYADMQEYKQDPFTRRRCRPTLVTKTKDQLLLMKLEEERKQQKANEEKKLNIQNKDYGISYSDMPEKKKKEVVVSPGVTKIGPTGEMLHANDLYSDHNFEVNIDLQLQPSPSMELTTKASVEKKATPSGPRRYLNLSEYKKKKGLI